MYNSLVTTTILQTKLHIPVARSKLVARPHLIKRLNESLDGRLTLISAPAGYGKTTLISQWSLSSDRLFAWLSLDEDDNDLIRFAQYLVGAFNRAEQELAAKTQELLQRSTAHITTIPSSKALITWLINDVLDSESAIVLVLDDYHTIQDKSVHEAVTLLLEQMPPNMNLVITTREDPPLPLSRLRSRGEMIEMRQSDLRFANNEISHFIDHTMGFELSHENTTLLEQSTEGWIAGIQLAAITLRERTDHDAFMRSFAGDHRYIVDYLTDEIISRQSDEIQNFLLTSSILDRLSGKICSALSDGEISPSRSQEILEYLDQSNLFVLPLDDQRIWYRYHHLMGQALRHYLRVAMPERLPELNSKASHWFEENGFYLDAVNYALRAGDINRSASLIEGYVPLMAYFGQLTTIAQGLAALQAETVRSSPWLSLGKAWLLFRSGNLTSLSFTLSDVESSLKKHAHADAGQIAGQVAIIKGIVAAIMGNMDEAIELLGDAVFDLPEHDLTARGHAQLLLASCLSWIGDFDWALLVYPKALSASRQAGHLGVMFDALGDRARLECWMGKLRQAERTCQEALQIASEHRREYGWQLPERGYIYIRYSTILLEWNKREQARHYARHGLEICEGWGQRELLIRSYIAVAAVLATTENLDEALSIVQRAKSLASTLSPWYEARATAAKVKIHLAQGNIDLANRLLRIHQKEFEGQLRFEMMECYLAYARILMIGRDQIASGDSISRSGDLLERMLAFTESVGATGYLIETLVLRALALAYQYKTESAMSHLKRALVLAEPEGYVRVFVDEGEPIAQLLRQLAVSGFMPDYVGRLITSFSSPFSDKMQSLSEPLSERELEVLRLVVAGFTNREIAEQLIVSLGTIKTHINHIYQKLGVRNRTQAVAQARDLNLV
jgi:LuxR family maltose regulon positive regulatory protein